MKKLEIENKTTTWVEACGCTMKKDENRWKIETYCSSHQPNFQKKANKLMHRRERKIGRGYTKSNK